MMTTTTDAATTENNNTDKNNNDADEDDDMIVCFRHHDGAPILLQRRRNKSSEQTTISIAADDRGGVLMESIDLERLLLQRMKRKRVIQVDHETQHHSQVQCWVPALYYCPRKDGSYLNCGDGMLVAPYSSSPLQQKKTARGGRPARTLFGLRDDHQALRLRLTCYAACLSLHLQDSPPTRGGPQTLPPRGPHSNWSRRHRCRSNPATDDAVPPTRTTNYHHQHHHQTPHPYTDLRWIDLRTLPSAVAADVPLVSTEAGVVQVLRSLLTASHDVSPWVVHNNNSATQSVLPAIVVLVLNAGVAASAAASASSSASASLSEETKNTHNSHNNNTRSFELFKDFRVSDVAPSWFLQGYTHLEHLEGIDDFVSLLSLTNNTNSNDTQNNTPESVAATPTTATATAASSATLLIYKKLSRRRTLHRTKPDDSLVGHDSNDKESMDHDGNVIGATVASASISSATATSIPEGCLWEEYETTTTGAEIEAATKAEFDQGRTTPEHTHGNATTTIDTTTATKKERRYRVVSPPYLNLQEEYPPDIMAKLFSKEAMEIFTQDAINIAQHCIAWPEAAHYKVSSDGTNDRPWTVFPLCHCFPANQPAKLTWIPSTQAAVPKTCQLLREALRVHNTSDRRRGNDATNADADADADVDSIGETYLRTALFSQLAPHSVLEEHTGWADLANHVLRLHIPLIVPNGTTTNKDDRSNRDNNNNSDDTASIEDDLCGTWVDGCIETHKVGRPLLFDDSKIHRAFNYSNGNRIVLIVDLIRPSYIQNNANNTNSINALPIGTAEAGHTEELDAFIAQMSIPK